MTEVDSETRRDYDWMVSQLREAYNAGRNGVPFEDWLVTSEMKRGFDAFEREMLALHDLMLKP